MGARSPAFSARTASHGTIAGPPASTWRASTRPHCCRRRRRRRSRCTSASRWAGSGSRRQSNRASGAAGRPGASSPLPWAPSRPFLDVAVRAVCATTAPAWPAPPSPSSIPTTSRCSRGSSPAAKRHTGGEAQIPASVRRLPPRRHLRMGLASSRSPRGIEPRPLSYAVAATAAIQGGGYLLQILPADLASLHGGADGEAVRCDIPLVSIPNDYYMHQVGTLSCPTSAGLNRLHCSRQESHPRNVWTWDWPGNETSGNAPLGWFLSAPFYVGTRTHGWKAPDTGQVGMLVRLRTTSCSPRLSP